MWPLVSRIVANETFTWPAMTSAIAGPPPLYGTCSICAPEALSKSAPARCIEPPLPELL
jgi:hypothetical protein